jgi:general secretion pathway protein D
MTPLFQPRAVLSRCITVLVISSLTLPTLAQTPVFQASQSPTPSPAPASSVQQPPPTTFNKTIQSDPTPLDKRKAEAAESAYLAGARALDRKDLSAAETEFVKATKLNPASRDYALALSLVHQRHIAELVQQAGKARLLGQNQKADALLAEARLLDPQGEAVSQRADPGVLPKLFRPEIEPWIKEGPSLAGPITLLPDAGIKSFHIHSDEQNVIKKVLSEYGIHPVFDDSVQHQDVRFDVDDVSYQQAAPVLLDMTHLFAVPLDSKSIFLAKDTPENRQRLERQLQETIYIPGMSNEQMDELGNVIRNVFDVKQITVGKASGNLVIRAPQETLTYVNLTLADLIDGGSQVMIELKLYTVDRTNQRTIGAQLPQQIGIYSVAGEAQNIVSSNQSLVNQAISQGLVPAGASNITIALALVAAGLVQSTLLSSTLGFVGGGISQTGVTTNQNPTFTLSLNASDTHALNDLQLRIGDRQTATFRVGERFPITTATYTNGVTGTTPGVAGATINGVSVSSLLNSSTSSITIPQIQYEDLGLTLKATPAVQKSGAIAMHLDLKIEALSGGALSNIPILNNQQFASDVTVDDGETALLVSTISSTESAAISGWPGLGELPGFQTATSDTMKNTSSSELLLLVTPHITRRRSNISAGPRIAVNLREQSN